MTTGMSAPPIDCVTAAPRKADETMQKVISLKPMALTGFETRAASAAKLSSSKPPLMKSRPGRDDGRPETRPCHVTCNRCNGA